jgi:superfamily II DNA/RNA helicase
VNYIHRVGRTGRYTDTGVAVTFVRSPNLVNVVSENHKVTFSELTDINKLIEEAEKCFERNA